jgi:small-conductance mechanosensitive channel
MEVVERTAAALGMSSDSLGRISATIGIVLMWVVLGRIARRLITRTVEDDASRFQMTRVSGYVLGGVSLLVIARLWVQDVSGVATYFGLLSAGIAIALQDPLTNLAGWLFILVRRPFRVGDRIQVGTNTGDVVDIRPFRFLMLEIGNWVHADQGTGRLLHVPNGQVFKNTVANYDEAFGYIWNEIEVTVTFESNWRKAKAALEEILEAQADKIDAHVRKRIDDAAHILHIKFPKLTPVVWVSVVDSGVRLTMRYLCKARARRSSSTQIWEKVLDAFGEMPDVDFSYPTMRYFDHVVEGKERTRPQPAVGPKVPPPEVVD